MKPVSQPLDKPGKVRKTQEELSQNDETGRVPEGASRIPGDSNVSAPGEVKETSYAYAPSQELVSFGNRIREQLEDIAEFTFPSSVQARFTRLMEKNTEGDLAPDEQEELRALVELNELVSILKGQARLLLHASRQ